ncbi:MAG: hypothetical protein GKS00_06815 [Alphaproteobacteria bacterium]|nr:hypothetical protein [Alphaproteobacteria bacterium]
MPKHVVVVLSEPVKGREEEFEDWYENTHIREVLETTGWESGQRFVLTAEKGQKCPLGRLAFYEAEAENGEDVIATLDATRSARKQSDSFNRKSAGLWVFSETGQKHHRGGD